MQQSPTKCCMSQSLQSTSECEVVCSNCGVLQNNVILEYQPSIEQEQNNNMLPTQQHNSNYNHKNDIILANNKGSKMSIQEVSSILKKTNDSGGAVNVAMQTASYDLDTRQKVRFMDALYDLGYTNYIIQDCIYRYTLLMKGLRSRENNNGGGGGGGKPRQVDVMYVACFYSCKAAKYEFNIKELAEKFSEMNMGKKRTKYNIIKIIRHVCNGVGSSSLVDKVQNVNALNEWDEDKEGGKQPQTLTSLKDDERSKQVYTALLKDGTLTGVQAASMAKKISQKRSKYKQ